MSVLRLLFVSPRFLFPIDSGGKIRTTQILRGMKHRDFEITLASPAPRGWEGSYAAEIASVCDRFVAWPEPERGPLFPITRMRFLGSRLPIPVATDSSAEARAVIAGELATRPEVVVFDFAHAVVLAPERIEVPSVLFTHNFEAEIFERHSKIASNALLRAVWRDQYRKMLAFERTALHRFDRVVAVSERDKKAFDEAFGTSNVLVIPTAVDLDFFRYVPPCTARRVVFLGSMDAMVNIDGIQYFADEIWAQIAARFPDATMTVVGRNPPPALVQRITRKLPQWSFTGFVEDVRPHIEGAAAFVVPIRVGGGTRLKFYEGMAMGVPIVSTTIGAEGLAAQPGQHYLPGDDPQSFAAGVIRLLTEPQFAAALSRVARALVVDRFGVAAAADAFEAICREAAGIRREPLATRTVA